MSGDPVAFSNTSAVDICSCVYLITCQALHSPTFRPHALVIYGFGILNDKLIEINKSKYVGYEEENVLKRVTFNDCGQRFVMVLELSDAPDKLLAVTADEVAYLLNNCLHPRNVY